MLPILSGRRARRFDLREGHGRLDDASASLPLLAVSSLGDETSARMVHHHEAQPAPRRRRNRSRNCRNFRLFGPHVQCAGLPATGEPDNQFRLLQQRRQDAHHRVQRLLEQHDLIESRRINARAYAVGHATSTTRRFYELFAHGYDPQHHAALSRQAEAFLRAAMREDVLCTEFTGVDMFLQQYRVGTETHSSMELALHRLVLLDNGDDLIQIKAEATTRFRISRATLERLFPSIIQDEELAQQLIGREYEMQYDKVFHFADGRIYQHESRIDLCSGLLQLVGDPFLALKLFEASSLTKHGHWRLDEVAEDRHALPNSILE